MIRATTEGAVIEQTWIERLTWGFLLAVASAAAAWFVASFRKVDRTTYESDQRLWQQKLEATEARVEKELAEKLKDMTERLAELRARQSKFDEQIGAMTARFDVRFDALRDQMSALNASLKEVAAEMRARK